MAKRLTFYGEILHFGITRPRVTGSGTLLMDYFSLDDVNSGTVAPLTMTTTTAREPTQLSNFLSQRGALRGRVVLSGEYFNISKIIVYVRPVATSFPQ